jgi:hypothetical protein
MRNFTLVFSFLLISVLAVAQQPVVTPVWDHSINGTADWSSGIPIGGEIPEWMGGTTERGMALHDGKLFILSRKVNPPVIVVLDAATGEHLYSAAIDTSVVKGGTLPVNDIAITPSGQILIANLSAGTHTAPFKVYLLEAVGEESFNATVLLEWMSQDTIDGVGQPNHRLGDGFAFYGNVSETENGFIIVGDATSTVEQTVFKWNVEAGVVNEEPEKIVVTEVYPAPTTEGAIPKFGITPRIHPISEEMFWADGHSTMPALYSMDGEMLSTFTGEFKPRMAGISGVKFFSFSGHDFILAPTSNHVAPAGTPPAAFQLFMIPESGAEEADSIAIFPERGLGANTNSSYAAPMAVDVHEDTVMMYIMSPNNGIAAFRLTLEEEMSDTQEWNISDEQFNALGSLTSTVTIDGLMVYAAEGKNVDVDANSKTLEEWEFTHRLKFGGSGSFDEEGQPLNRVVAFGVPGNSKITIALQSSSGSEDRVLNVAVGHKDSIIAEVPALGASISKGEVEYTGDSATIFLYSPSSGVNIYLIKVEPLVVSSPVVNVSSKDILVYPNPASDRVFVSVERPTQVAVYNLAGMMVKSRLLESKTDYIEVHDLAPGMYIIRSQMSNEFSKKLIIK